MKHRLATLLAIISLLLNHNSGQCQNRYIPLTLQIGVPDSIFSNIFICADSSYSCLDRIAYKDATILGEHSEYNLEALQETNLLTTFDNFKNFIIRFKKGGISIQIPHYHSMEDRTGQYEEDGYLVYLGAYSDFMIPTDILRPVLIDKHGYTISSDTFFVKLNGINMFLNTKNEIQELTTNLPDSGMTSHTSFITKDSIIVKNVKSVVISNEYSTHHQDKNKKWKILTVTNAEILLPKSSKFIKAEYFTIDTDGNSEYIISK